MFYPNHLLPKKRFKYINLDKIPQNTFLVRRCVCDHIEHIKKDVDGNCLVKNIDHLGSGLSCNLLGVFLKTDIRYNSKEPEWKPCNKVIKVNKIKYEYLEKSLPVYISIHDVNNQMFPYQHPEKVKKENITLQNISGNQKLYNELIMEEFSGKSIVKHIPTLANFWHFEIKFLDENGNYIAKNNTEGYKKIAKSCILSFMITVASYKEPIIINILESKFYDPKLPCFLQTFLKRSLSAFSF